jgi:phage gp29-like protein
MFSAKAATPPLKRATGGLSEILLPAARDRWMLPLAAQMTPARIEQILRAALTSESPANEQALYDLMEATWPRLLKNRMEVTDAVVSLDWNLMDAPDGENTPGMKELAGRAKNGMSGDPCCDGQGWRATMESLMSAWFRGISISEVDWEYRGGGRFPAAWLPKQTRDVHPRYFGWKSDGRLMLYPDGQPEHAMDFPKHKFLIAIRKAGKGHPSGTALLRALAWWWAAANFASEWLLNFAQIFGQPFRWATYDGSQEGVKLELAAMMEEMGSAAWGIGPDGTKVEFYESSKSGADNPQAHMLDRADMACDLLVLGQTLTGSVSAAGGSRALGEVHSSVRSDIIDSAALWLAEILNEQLIPSIAAVNHGEVTEDSGLPWFQPARKSKKDSKTVAETFKVIIEAGIPVLKEEVYDALDLSEPKEGDNIFGGVAASSGVSGAILTALSAAGLRVTDDGIRQLSESVQIGIERDPGAQAPLVPGDPAADVTPSIRRVLAKLPLDAREYFMARLLDEK